MGFKIMVDGPRACYSRPEMKVERVSYDVPTPTALCGMLKSIYWKPAIRYVIDRIIVFNPIEFQSIRRNEVKDKIALSKIKNQMNGGDADPRIYASESRSQRSALVLKNVRYGVEFHFELTGLQETETDVTRCENKHYNIILRRLRNGQAFRQPCLGCSEFPARKIELVEDFDLSLISPEILQLGDVDLGYMLQSLHFCDKIDPEHYEQSEFSDKSTAHYYHPHMVGGIIDVQKYWRDEPC